MERKKWSSSIWSFPIFADTRFAFIIIIVEFVARFLLFLFQGIIWMEIGGWTKRSAKKSLQITRHDTKHVGERSRNVIVSKFDCFADSISSSVRLASSRKSGEGREEWLMHKRCNVARKVSKNFFLSSEGRPGRCLWCSLRNFQPIKRYVYIMAI